MSLNKLSCFKYKYLAYTHKKCMKSKDLDNRLYVSMKSLAFEKFNIFLRKASILIFSAAIYIVF